MLDAYLHVLLWRKTKRLKASSLVLHFQLKAKNGFLNCVHLYLRAGGKIIKVHTL